SNKIDDKGANAIAKGINSCNILTNLYLHLKGNQTTNTFSKKITKILKNLGIKKKDQWDDTNQIVDYFYNSISKILVSLVKLKQLELGLDDYETLLKSSEIINCRNIRDLKLLVKQNDLESLLSSLTQKKKQLVFDQDVMILNKQQPKKINKMKRLSLVKINERVNHAEENKNQIYNEEKMMERLEIPQKINSGLLQTSQNLNITDYNFSQFITSNRSQSNLPSNYNLPSPRLSSLSQTFENQSIKSKKIKNGIEQRAIKFQSSAQDQENQSTFNGFENNQPNSNLLSSKYSKLQTLNTETDNQLFKQDLPYKKQDPLWFLNFDTIKSFKMYFPHNNYERVIHKYNQKANAKRKQNLPQRSAKNKFSLFNLEQRKNSTKI
ncbi:hypothetical protein ABPG72_020340, partial [Tetrahymena utriculariae]